MDRSGTTRWLGRAVVLLALLLGACGSSDDALDPGPTPTPTPDDGIDYNPRGSIAGTLTISEVGNPALARSEVEPNDSLDAAQVLGALRPGETVTVRGRTEAAEGTDPFDGYEFFAPERVRLTAELHFARRGDNVLQLGLFDPVTLQVVQTLTAAHSPAVARFCARGAFHLVVTARSGASDYVLSVRADAAADPLAAGDAGAPPFLGQVRPGDALRVAGDAADARAFLVSAPAATGLTFAVEAGAPGAIHLLDATTDLDAPSALAVLEGTTSAAEVPGGTLLLVRATPPAASGAWVLAVEAGAPRAPLARPAVAGALRLAPLAAETARWGRTRPGSFYGEPRREFVPGEALVGYAPEDQAGALATVAQGGGALRESLGGSRAARVGLALDAASDADAQARATLAQIAALRGSPGVAYAEPNWIYRAFAEPNDQHYGLQWHYPLISLPNAWNVTKGSAAVIVAVIDTGRTEHPDLAGRQSGGYDFISDPSNALDGNGRDADPTDPGDGGSVGSSSWHGTHVAGTIGAATNNSTGVAGVTWQTTIMHLRVLGRYGGTVADISEAIRYAGRLSNGSGTLPAQRANVINMSLGGGGYSQTMQNAVTAARNEGVVIFAAAGNEASGSPGYPAAYAGVSSIAAVDVNGDAAPYSNFGSTIDFAAPGGDTSVDRNGDGYVDGVLSTLWDDSKNPPTPVYAFYQGTSMACPHAAGVAALVLAVGPTLTPDQVEAILASTAQDLGAPGRDNTYGHGLINAYGAVLAAQGGGTGPTQMLLTPPTLNFGNDIDQLTIQVTNVGGGLLQVQTVTAITDAGGPWLQAVTQGTGDSTRNVDGIRVTVDRAGLDPGYYAGRVAVTSNGGNADVEVMMAVEVVGPLPTTTPIYVELRNPGLDRVVQQLVVRQSTGLAYRFQQVDPGGYYVMAGTDLDLDGAICDEDEWCGTWPLLGERSEVILPAYENVTGIDFVVAPDQQVAGTAKPSGVRKGAVPMTSQRPILLKVR